MEQPTTKPRILVVDDEKANRDWIVRLLERKGYAMTTAVDGQSALDAVSADPPDLVLLDLRMPGLDGFDTVRVLKSRPEQAALPILFMSGFPEKNRVLFAGQTGAVDFLPKPLDMKALVGKVLAILTKPAA